MLSVLSMTVQAKSIVILGDSISAGYGLETGQGWVALLEQRLQQSDKKYRIYNESISGDTSAGGLARIDKILKDYQPDIVIIELGANDGLRGLSPKIMQANLAEIIRRSQHAGARVLLLTMRIPPNYGKRYTQMFYKVYQQLGEQLSVAVVPFILEDVAIAKELMQADGLHPNQKAQKMIEARVWQYLQKLL